MHRRVNSGIVGQQDGSIHPVRSTGKNVLVVVEDDSFCYTSGETETTGISAIQAENVGDKRG